MEEKYVVYFTGYCPVWAESPEDALERFENRDVCLESAEYDVLSVEHDWYGYDGEEY